MLLLQGQDCGVDVDSVENLIRRHEETEREAGVIQERSKVSWRACFNTCRTLKETLERFIDLLQYLK